MSTVILIPWILYGFKQRGVTFLGLNQTKRSLFILLSIEFLLWTVLMILLDTSNPEIVGQDSFAWMYFWIYEKGIFPTLFLTELLEGTLGDKIDAHYQFLYLITALLIDYLILFIISPRPKQLS